MMIPVARLAQLVERVIDVDDVTGSNPVSRTWWYNLDMFTLLKLAFSIVVLYLAVVGLLYMIGTCPKYVDNMPKIVEPGSEYVQPIWQKYFCPFAEKVY